MTGIAAQPIYLDHNATTPVDPRVVERITRSFLEVYGNPSSRTHAFGWRAEECVEEARRQLAALIGAAKAKTLIFTSGATESNNLAIKGAVRALRSRGDHVVTQVTEHKAVLDTLKALEREGVKVTYLPVDGEGRVDPGQVANAIGDRTVLVSIMHANNEIGAVQPLTEIGATCRARGVLFHCDAVQALGQLDVNVERDAIDLLSISAHKMYGPKGVGALYVAPRRPAIRLEPLLHGGGQERAWRPGTLNVPGIVGLGAAAEIARSEGAAHSRRIAELRDRLWRGLSERIERIHRNGPESGRLPNNLNVSFECIEGESLMMSVPEIAVASGSACTSALKEPSHVLKAIGRSDELAHSSIRFGLGRSTTEAEVDATVECLVRAIERLRAMSPLWPSARRGRARASA